MMAAMEKTIDDAGWEEDDDVDGASLLDLF